MIVEFAELDFQNLPCTLCTIEYLILVKLCSLTILFVLLHVDVAVA